MLRKSYKIYVIQQVYRFCWMFLEEQQKKVMEIYFFLGIIPTAFCKSVMCLKRKMTRSASDFSLMMYNLVKSLAHPAGFEPTACRLGV